MAPGAPDHGAAARAPASGGPAPARPAWLETGVPNLDRVLGGGLSRGTVAMVVGPPGSGKTILGQQVAFHCARRGGVALYLTGYSETHDRLLAHSRGLAFFAPELLGTRVQLGSLPDFLAQGAAAAEDAVVATARAQRAALVVLDGFRSIRRLFADDLEAARFLYSLGAKLALLGATLLVLEEGDAEDHRRDPEQTVCDAILALRRERRGGRHRRLLEALKVRGAAPLEGVHPFAIDAHGITVYPRFEAVVPAAEPVPPLGPVAGREPWTGGRAGFGIADLDALLGGGLTAGTTTLCAGSPGAGRTLLGLHFLAAGARAGESGLFLGFMESAAQLRAKARAFGLDLDGTEAAGRIELLVLPAYDLEADRAAWLLREAVERRSVRRLVVDSAIELQRGLLAPERAPEFFAALAAYLRGRDVTTYLTIDIPIFVGPELSFADTPLWVVAENLLLLRQVEYRGQLRRLVSVLKMRFSDYDRTVREFTVTEGQGIRVVGPAPPAEGLLTGLARPWPPWPPWPPAARGEAAGETGPTGPAGPAGPRGSSAPTAPSAPPPAPWGPNEE